MVVRGPPALFEEFERLTGRRLTGFNANGIIVINPTIITNPTELAKTLIHEAAALSGLSHEECSELEKIIRVKVGINGFGRIGRLILRATLLQEDREFEIVAINDLADIETSAHLFKHDSTFGPFPGEVKTEGDTLIIDGRRIKVFAERNPASIPWKKEGVDIVIESTGLFTDADKAGAHIEAGAEKIVITAPAKGEDITIVMGIIEYKYDPRKHRIISNASCTTNCLGPVA